MSITLTTSPQVLATNLANTIGVRLVGWYSDVSGNSATVHMTLQANSQGTTYTGTNKTYSLILGSAATGTVSFASTLPQDTWVDVASLTQSYSGGARVSTSGTIWTYVFGSTSVETSDVFLPAFITPPSGLAVSVTDTGDQSITANVSLTSWGNAGDANTRFKEFSVSRSSDMANTKYGKVYGNDLSTSFTINNSSSGDSSWDLLNNGRYYYRAVASNGSASTSTNATEFITALTGATTTLAAVTGSTATFSYSLPVDGGAFQRNIECSLDNGSTWSIVATPTSGQAVESAFTISGLTKSTSYTAKIRTVAGTQSVVVDIPFTTTDQSDSFGLYGSDNNVAKKITKYYVPVNNVAASVVKIYGSEGGVAKRIY